MSDVAEKPWVGLAGMTREDCAAGCNADGCVITGSMCAHPLKGGVQHALQSPRSLVRYAQACKHLGVANKNETEQ